MQNTPLPPGRLPVVLFALVLVLLPIVLLACGAETPTRRPTREPPDTATPSAREDRPTRTPRADSDRPTRRPASIGSIFKLTSPETDREALVALYEATGGPYWTNNDNWLTDAPLNEWQGLTVDEEGRVTEIYLSSNELEGEIPPEFGGLDLLIDLELSDNYLEGEIPPELGRLISLENLNLSHNFLEGEIPPELESLEWLTILQLTGNSLSGEIPEELGSLSNLRVLLLDNNQLSGDVPEELGDLSNLRQIGLSGNPQITGCVPSSLASKLNSNPALGDVPVCGGMAAASAAPPFPTATLAPAPTSAQFPLLTRPPTPTHVYYATPTPTRVYYATPTRPPTPTRVYYATPTRPPTPTRVYYATPTRPPTPTRPVSQTGGQSLASYARNNANGPGAIYVGDLSQLAGPAPISDLGDDSGNVPLDALRRHYWIYQSAHYQSLVRKARLTNPTRLTSRGERIQIELACLHMSLFMCQMLENYFAPNIAERTNGQVQFKIEGSSSGSGVLHELESGSLEAATTFGFYHRDELPAFDVQNLHGAHSSRQLAFMANVATLEDLDELISSETGGGIILDHIFNWEYDRHLLCRTPAYSAQDLRSKTLGYVGTFMADWMDGMAAQTGASVIQLEHRDVSTEFADDNLDCVLTSYNTAVDWGHEFAYYIVGSHYRIPITNNVISRHTWNRIPADLQQIILEEAAKSELEALRLGAIRSEIDLTRLQDDGMQYIPFSPELQNMSRQAAIDNVIPNWVDRVGNTRDPIITDTFNRKLGPIVDMHINSDGTVTDLR